MRQRFLCLERTLDRCEQPPEPAGWLWMSRPFRKGTLAAVSAAIMILGLVMQLRGSPSVLAHSIEQLKVIVSISVGLNRASSMDCTVRQLDAEGKQTSYRIRWRALGDVRVDRDSPDGAETLWISSKNISIAGPGGRNLRSMPISTMTPGLVWQPALEFMTPKILAQHLGQHYGLMQSGGRDGSGTDEFRIFGREGEQDVEITVDAKTYLPKALEKFARDSGPTREARKCSVEVRFLWNQPIPAELFGPPIAAAER